MLIQDSIPHSLAENNSMLFGKSVNSGLKPFGADILGIEVVNIDAANCPVFIGLDPNKQKGLFRLLRKATIDLGDGRLGHFSLFPR